MVSMRLSPTDSQLCSLHSDMTCLEPPAQASGSAGSPNPIQRPQAVLSASDKQQERVHQCRLVSGLTQSWGTGTPQAPLSQGQEQLRGKSMLSWQGHGHTS